MFRNQGAAFCMAKLSAEKDSALHSSKVRPDHDNTSDSAN